MVTGGDVLLRVDVPGDGMSGPSVGGEVIIELNGAEVSAAFQPLPENVAAGPPAAPGSIALLGYITGLATGSNRLVVQAGGGASPEEASLELVNHPVQGPVFAGPHEQPFFCTTHLFRTVAGDTLGAPLDADCSVERRVSYVYRTRAGRIAPLPDPNQHPDDLTFTLTTEGRRVPFIVRVETGTANRAIYEFAILHDPATDPEPDPWARSPGWNGRLIYRYGGGCRPGWFQQGSATAGVVHDVELGQGYAIASSTLNVFAANCSELLSAETTMLVKERFTEAYGPPLFTIGWGASGGAHQAHGIADAYPGLLDGLFVGMSFPDMTSSTSTKSIDAMLLGRYFRETAPGRFTEEQQRAVAGFAVLASVDNLTTLAMRADPDAFFADVVPMEARYDAESNPRGARATIYDHTVNVYGRDPETGSARRPLDNVGVQYGLAALNEGIIDFEQFADLNERIGGLDVDLNPQPGRTVADPAALVAAYRTGRVVTGAGLASVPIVDYRAYLDLRESGDNHMKLHSFEMRDRLIRANGHADNQVILVRDSRWSGGFGATYSMGQRDVALYQALSLLDRWLTGVVADGSGDSLPVKVVRTKPVELVDACWTPDGERVVEPQSYGGPGICGELYPSWPIPAMVAGAPLAGDILKCTLKPIDPADYAFELTTARRDRLERVFPDGVCDWSKPGVGQGEVTESWLRKR